MGPSIAFETDNARSIAKQVAYQVWQEFIGKWEISVIPENIKALAKGNQ